MLLNLSVDLLTGAVPVLGDLWDFFFRANRRNLQLLRQRAAGGEIAPSHSDGLVVAGAAAVFLAALAVPVVVLWKILRARAGLVKDYLARRPSEEVRTSRALARRGKPASSLRVDSADTQRAGLDVTAGENGGSPFVTRRTLQSAPTVTVTRLAVPAETPA